MARITRRTLTEPVGDELTGLPALVQRLYLSRGVRSNDELDYRLQRLPEPSRMQGTEAAARLLADALAAQNRVLIVGDFDADGATSTALAVLALKAFGFSQVDYLVPDRFRFGYGLTPEIVEVAAEREPDLIITVDNGIASLAGVARAKQLGIAVLITDHHLPGAELPAADVIVNPNAPGCPFPDKSLAGVGVIFYVMLALRQHLRHIGWFAQRAEPNLAQWLDLVAVGTVADVVPLDAINRTLVAQGLKRMRSGHARPGILALLAVAQRSHTQLSPTDLGFVVGPRLNAAGRLDDMSLGIQCLLAEDAVTAQAYAEALNDLNSERRNIEAGMRREAERYVEALALEGELPWGLCLYQDDWHEGVIGIVAGRIKERCHRPVVAFAKTEQGLLKGSARSIPGLHLRDTLDAIATRHPELLQKFGGHAMAAGLSLDAAHLPAFTQAFDDEVRARLDASALDHTWLTDGELEHADITLTMAEQLRLAGPWGQGFPEPLFDGVFRVESIRVLAARHLKLQVTPAGSRVGLDAIQFNGDVDSPPQPGQHLRLVYRLDVNEYRGQRALQLLVQHWLPTT